MIHLPSSVRVYLCLTPCDMRRSFDRLYALVRDHLELDAFAGHLYLFFSRRRERVTYCSPLKIPATSGSSNPARH
jgi:transposase